MDPISAAGTYPIFNAFQYRNGIRIITPGNNSSIPAVYACDATAGVENNVDDGQNIAMNYLSWGDLSAYLDWAALRPMTELEFEKVCRGTAPRVAGEYIWGTTTINPFYSNTLTNGYKANEGYATVINGACVYGLGSSSPSYGPVRCGIFATGSSGRASAGASYYGAMEMGGNLWERVITTANATGTAFTGVLGDGTLTVLGESNQTNWPSPATAIGVGNRGGDYINTAVYVRTSDRSSVGTPDAAREINFGGRGVR